MRPKIIRENNHSSFKECDNQGFKADDSSKCLGHFSNQVDTCSLIGFSVASWLSNNIIKAWLSPSKKIMLVAW